MWGGLGFGSAPELAETALDGPSAASGRGAVSLLSESTRGSLAVVDSGSGVETEVACSPPCAPEPVVPVTASRVGAFGEEVDMVGVKGGSSVTTGSGGPGIWEGGGNFAWTPAEAASCAAVGLGRLVYAASIIVRSSRSSASAKKPRPMSRQT